MRLSFSKFSFQSAALLLTAFIFIGASTTDGRADTPAEPIDMRRLDDRSLAAIVTGVDQMVCTATVIGPRHVLTAASCIIDPETGEAFPDRQVIPRIALDEGYIPVSRRFVERVYMPLPIAPFGTGSTPESRIAIIEVGELSRRSLFSIETEEAPFYQRPETTASDDRLNVVFYDAATGGAMKTSHCVALAIEPGDLMPMHCVLPKGAVGAPIRAESGLLGVYLSPDLGRYIGQTEIASISSIVTGLGSPYFRAIEVEPRRAITFVLTNRCDVPIDYNLHYRAMDGDRAGEFTDTNGTVEPGERRFADLLTDNGLIYLRGTAGDGEYVWDGSRVFEGGRHFGIRIDHWGDYFHALHCDHE